MQQTKFDLTKLSEGLRTRLTRDVQDYLSYELREFDRSIPLYTPDTEAHGKMLKWKTATEQFRDSIPTMETADTSDLGMICQLRVGRIITQALATQEAFDRDDAEFEERWKDTP